MSKPKIDFYLIPDTSEKKRLLFACHFIEEAYKQQHRIYIHTENQSLAQELDQLLWIYREDSFLPHELYHSKNNQIPIQIGFNNIAPEIQQDILINLDKNVPEFYLQFARIVELVSDDPTVQAAARERYKFYRAQGAIINTHKISNKTSTQTSIEI